MRPSPICLNNCSIRRKPLNENVPNNFIAAVMLKINFLLIFMLCLNCVRGQELVLLTPMSEAVFESSALIYLENKLITINDAGNTPVLFEIDSLSGNVTRIVTVSNADNTDWEALAYDSTYIYIGDFGNNNGSRTNLCVYRIAQEAYFGNTNDEVLAEAITFAYADQTDFSTNTFNTRYDAETMVSKGDSLYIFTKNWVENTTFMYPLSKIPGDYLISKTDSLGVPGWVTDGAYYMQTDELFLLGYSLQNIFGISVFDFQNGLLNESSQTYSLTVPQDYSIQLEGVAFIHSDLLYFSSEAGFSGYSGLFKLPVATTGLGQIRNLKNSVLYPNPAEGYIVVANDKAVEIHIFDLNGRCVCISKPGRIDVSLLCSGIYLAKAYDKNHRSIQTHKFVIR